MPTVTVNNISMFYETVGSGEPVVFISGFSCDHTMWLETAEHFKKTHQVILFDNRGVGRTDVPVEKYSIEQMTKDVVELCKKINIKKAIFVGNSMGGLIVQQLAYQYPEMVKLAVISNSVTQANVNFGIYLQAQLEMIKSNTPLTTLIKAACSWVYSYHFLSQPGVLDRLIQLGLANPYPFTIPGYEGQFAAIKDFDSSSWVHKLKVPTLVIAGEQDLVFPEHIVKSLAEKIPNAKFHTFKNCSHVPPIEYPKEFADLVRKFI